MNRKITIEERDDMPQGGKQAVAAQGRGGDTQLAHVNPWESVLLKALGGSGTVNPKTGLKEYTNDWGLNQDRNKWISDVTGYTGDYGGGQFGEWAKSMGIDPNNLIGAYDTISTANNTPTNGSFFNFPTDIMPTSTSTSTSYTGIPTSYQDTLLSTLMPKLQTALSNMSTDYDDYTNQALNAYNMNMENTLKENIPAAIAKLANRGIISSSEGENVLSKVMSDAAINSSTKGYETAMSAALQKAGIPSTLATILSNLGKSSTSTSTSNTSDPTVMYQTMANLIKSMM